MDLSQALSIANQAMLAQFNRGLSDVETAIVKGAWQNQTYEKIAEVFGYSNSYLSRDVGPKFWKILTLALGEPVSKNNFQAALERKWQQQIKQHQAPEAFELRKNPDLDNSTAHSSLEQSIMYWLAINREWTTIPQLVEDITPAVRKLDLLEALESLMWRSLIENQSGNYTLQCVIVEYVTDRLVEQVTQEITEEGSTLKLLHSHALAKNTVKDHIRESQFRMIVEPITIKLGYVFPYPQALASQIHTIFKQVKNHNSLASGYASGNLINLCHHLKIDLSGYDFSKFSIRN